MGGVDISEEPSLAHERCKRLRGGCRGRSWSASRPGAPFAFRLLSRLERSRHKTTCGPVQLIRPVSLVAPPTYGSRWNSPSLLADLGLPSEESRKLSSPSRATKNHEPFEVRKSAIERPRPDRRVWTEPLRRAQRDLSDRRTERHHGRPPVARTPSRPQRGIR